MGSNNSTVLQKQPRHITGYIQEGRAYFQYLTRRHRRPKTKFVILGQQRSGSTLLVSLLDSHPDICCLGELLYYRRISPFAYLKSLESISERKAFGFKLMPNHIGYQGRTDANRFMLELNDAGYRVVKLSRRNLFHSAISMLYAQKRKKYHYNQTEILQGLPRLELNPALVAKTVAWFEEMAELQDAITRDIPHLALTYEDHLLEPSVQQTTVEKVTDFLELPHVRLRSDLARITSKDYSDYVLNMEEIREALKEKSDVYQTL